MNGKASWLEALDFFLRTRGDGDEEKRVFADSSLGDGIREMAVGNTFGATALSSYGGFWIALAITFTPGGFAIISTIEGEQGPGAFYDSFAFFIFVREPLYPSFP